MGNKKSVLVLSPRTELVPRAEHIIDVFTEMNMDIKIISPEHIVFSERRSCNRVLTNKFINPIRSSVPFKIMRFLWISIYYLFKGYRMKPDVVYCPHIGLLPIASIISFVTGSTLVYDVIEKYAEGYWNSKYITKCILTIESVFVKSADIILVIDSRDDVVLNRYKNENAIVEVIYNVPHIKRYDNKAMGQSFVYVGNLEDVKGVKNIIPAFAQIAKDFPQANVKIIGPSFDAIRKEMETEAEKREVRKKITFTGQIPYGEVHTHLLEADIGLAPYLNVQENRISRFNSRKIFDYMNAGLPIIGPNFGGIGDAIEQLECGKAVNTENDKDLADAMRDLLENTSHARQLGCNGRRQIEQSFNWNNEKEKVKYAINKVVTQ